MYRPIGLYIGQGKRKPDCNIKPVADTRRGKSDVVIKQLRDDNDFRIIKHLYVILDSYYESS